MALGQSISDATTAKLFLAGDVMTGRGIDQVMRHPSDPQIYEPFVKSAVDYVDLAEKAGGAILRPFKPTDLWGHALKEFQRYAPDVKIINLETSITTSDDPWPDKGIHYRMHPKNINYLVDAGIDCCTLANNHSMDWGHPGLKETLKTLRAAGIRTAGAGSTISDANAAAIFKVNGVGRVIVIAFGFESSGIYPSWAATNDGPGVNLLPDSSPQTVNAIARQVKAMKRPKDIVVASIHWGGNWGYQIPTEQREFAHRLIDQAAVDVIHGHSSHHVKAMEMYKRKLILYGCGDFINDYEGIEGYEEYRGDLSLMYFPTIDATTGNLLRLEMTPTQLKRFAVHPVSSKDARWLTARLNRECGKFGLRVQLDKKSATLSLQW